MNNIEINDKLETDIENKYIKFKENVKLTTEEAIYILKRKDFCDEIENIAIENLIKENKELREKDIHITKETVEFVNSHYIHKSKVKELAKKYEFALNGYDSSTADYKQSQNLGRYMACVELLEEGE